MFGETASGSYMLKKPRLVHLGLQRPSQPCATALSPLGKQQDSPWTSVLVSAATAQSQLIIFHHC